MIKKVFFVLSFVLAAYQQAYALAKDFAPFFKVDMQQEIPDIYDYAEEIRRKYKLYDKKYISRFYMGRTFNKEFARTIKLYGLSEGRIKSNYEDELLEIISWLPKETYQYIGPMLFEVPGMSEKILNLPGIKETKNQFPKDLAEKYKGDENIEYLSPALYFILMPDLWSKKNPKDLDKPEKKPAKFPEVQIELPDFLKEKIGSPIETAQRLPASAQKEATSAQKMAAVARKYNLRTINPSLTTPLTRKDVAAFISTIDMVMDWGMQNDMSNYSALIRGEALMDMWEQEQGTALSQNDLKDVVNPCQRLVLKTRFSGLYESFSTVVAQKGFSPEEWAYTCDRTIKAFRVAEASLGMAYAVRFHRRGYYNQYISKLPKRWQDEMYAVEEAIIEMYRASREDVESVRPYKDEILRKMIKIHGVMLTAPIIY